MFDNGGSLLDYAQIVSFEGSDRIQLQGTASNYSLGAVPSSVSATKSSVGIFTNSGTELIAVVNNGLNSSTNLAADNRFLFV